jgi:hypothetical protein
MYAEAPAHDSRVTSAILRGAGDAEIGRVLAEVTAEYGQRAVAERQGREQSRGVMWDTPRGTLHESPAGPMGVSLDLNGYPVQRSAVNADVPPFGSEEVSAPDAD